MGHLHADATTLLLAVLALGAVACIAVAVRRAPARRLDPDATVRARAVMTANELDFHATLRAALPDAIVLAQVSFGALLEPRGPAPGTSAWWSNRNRFAQKVADWVVLDAKGRLVAVIELDDRTHDRVKDARRDALLASAGIGVLRYESRAKPSGTTVRRDLGMPARTGLAWG